MIRSFPFEEQFARGNVDFLKAAIGQPTVLEFSEGRHVGWRDVIKGQQSCVVPGDEKLMQVALDLTSPGHCFDSVFDLI